MVANEMKMKSMLTLRSETTNDQLCIEVVQSECVASNSLHEQEGEVVADVVADYVDYVELISGQILDISNEKENEDEAIQVENEVVITNKQHEHIALDQIYQDKETLKIVPSHYAIINSFQFYVNPTNNVMFEVQNGDKKSIVDLGLRTCTCNWFQMDQLPCAHVIAVLKKVNHHPYDYCSTYYKKETMISAYEQIVYSVGNRETWEIPETIKSMSLYPP
ncbi:hypothetical protein POM88_014423 [Heracleum sosnowskyi]|uniref:SWIM-type domain-containing protein n=1 Tax=Heracleum sosnowskyi TaxID=360622 RepID=A0AAD8J3M9_9APIA|nr:hypothetical protein POM88_014423 [Heracleum sosnowskyi]